MVAARTVLDADDIRRAVRRMAHEIIESARGVDNLLLLGIPTRGVHLARRIADEIADIEGAPVPCGALDITLYRDDLGMREVRALEQTDIPVGGVDGRIVVLIDDVLYSGRTIRAALDALANYGRPAAVRLAVLVDRGHRELPIRPDFVGKNLPTSQSETVKVRFMESDDEEFIVIEAVS